MSRYISKSIAVVLLIVIIYIQSLNSFNSQLGILERNNRLLCKKPDPIPNAEFRFKRGGAVLRHICNYGYTLIGARNTPCVLGKWQGDRPVCARSGCKTLFNSRDNGVIQLVKQYEVALFCAEGYHLAGNRFAFCNGTDWDRQLGECRRRQNKVEHECDFETDDICGWVSDQLGHFHWKRVMAANVFTSFQTGPRHDHTTMSASGGHYMLMESYGYTNSTITLTSPIYKRDLSLKTACCFRFYYFMYGSGVGNLYVLIKPVSRSLIELHKNNKDFVKFHKSGNQNNIWNEAHFNIGEMDDDFQIVFIASDSKSHLSDIAIDDVKLMTGAECKLLDKSKDGPDDSSEYETTTTEETLYDTQSCVSHCGIHASGIMRQDKLLIGICSCHLRCIEDNNCCPDFVAVCLDGDGTSNEPDDNIDDPSTYTSTEVNFPKEKIEAATTMKTKSSSNLESLTTTMRTTTQNPFFLPTFTTKRPTTSNRKSLTTSKTITWKSNNYTTASATTTTTTNKSTSTNAMPTTKNKSRITTTKKLLTNQKTTSKIPNKNIPKTSSTFSTITANEKNIEGTTMQLEIITSITEKTTLKLNNKKRHVWTWESNGPTIDHTDRSSSFIILLTLFGLFVTVIIIGAVYRKRKGIFATQLGKLLRKNNSTGTGVNALIIANFASKETPSISGANTYMKFLKPNGKEKRKSSPKQRDDDQQVFTGVDQLFLNDSDSITLL